MNKHLDTLSLINYREAGGLPLRSISRLPEAEAHALAHQLARVSLSRNNRYRDGFWEGYYRSRLRPRRGSMKPSPTKAGSRRPAIPSTSPCRRAPGFPVSSVSAAS